MANTTTTTTARAPTELQAELIKLARRRNGVTRAEVRDVLNWTGDNIPVQSILKRLAANFGFEFATAYAPGENNRQIAIYSFAAKAARAAKAKRPAKAAAIAIVAPKKAAKPAKAAAIAIVAPKKAAKPAKAAAKTPAKTAKRAKAA